MSALHLPLATSVFQTCLDALSGGSLYALFALGISLLFGIIRLVNFAQGGIVMAGAYVLVATESMPVPVKLVIVVATTIALSLAVDRIAFRPIRRASAETLLVTSFAVGALMQAVALMISNDKPTLTSVSPWLDGTVGAGSLQISRITLVTIATTVVLLVLLALLLKKTSVGLHMRAAAEDFPMSQVLGVKSNRIIAIAFAISGAIAGISSFLFVAQGGTVSPTIGVTPVLFGFVGATIGGLGSLSGAAVGGFLLGAATQVMYTLLPQELIPYTNGFLFLLVFLFFVFRPQGLFPVSSGERI